MSSRFRDCFTASISVLKKSTDLLIVSHDVLLRSCVVVESIVSVSFKKSDLELGYRIRFCLHHGSHIKIQTFGLM